MIRKFTLSLLVFFILFLTSAATFVFADDENGDDRPGYKRFEISGTGVHDFSTQIVHWSKPTGSGKREVTTETIELWGDLEGRVLYQPRGVYNFNKGTLVNTGNQVFSGTVLGSKPVLLFDDEFRFEVNLFTGSVRGEVYLTQHISGPKISCELTVVDDGIRPSDGQPLFRYDGVCWSRKGR